MATVASIDRLDTMVRFYAGWSARRADCSGGAGWPPGRD